MFNVLMILFSVQYYLIIITSFLCEANVILEIVVTLVRPNVIKKIIHSEVSKWLHKYVPLMDFQDLYFRTFRRTTNFYCGTFQKCLRHKLRTLSVVISQK